ncbi:MAG: prolyl oligopeptidase family serine peptidase [Verrucomicrobiales bacterium]
MRRLTKLPIWVFHGAKDPVVALEESDRLVSALKKNGAKEVQFTIYPEAGHDSWTQAYATDALYEWMMAQKRQP